MPEGNKMFSLEGKIAVITGGTKRYGLAMAEGLAQGGAVVILSSRNKKTAEEYAKPMRQQGLKVYGAALDQADDASIDAFISDIIAEHGKIDIFVNSARHIAEGTAFEITRQELDKTFTINVTGLILIVRRVIKEMRKTGGGSIVNIGSIYGMGGQDPSIYDDPDKATVLDYSIVKGGMVAWSKQIATMFAGDNIRCNCLTLGGLKQPEMEGTGFLKEYCRRTPMGRMSDPEDVKGPIVFLASDASAYVTGANLIVDGGWTAW